MHALMEQGLDTCVCVCVCLSLCVHTSLNVCEGQSSQSDSINVLKKKKHLVLSGHAVQKKKKEVIIRIFKSRGGPSKSRNEGNLLGFFTAASMNKYFQQCSMVR